MTKQYYQTLEISENATAEQIKTAYRKLAARWHPDKWVNKSLEERKQANKKMQEINQAYEVLGDEEKKRKYDAGVNFSTARNAESFEEYVRRTKEQTETYLKQLAKFLERREVWSAIWNEMLVNGVQDRHLDSNLWVPCSNWGDKVYEIEIGDDDNDKEGIDRRKLNEFKEKMIAAIRKRGAELEAGINNPYVDKTRTNAIKAIEAALALKGLKAADLGAYVNYREQINSLPKVWKINAFTDKVIAHIYAQARRQTGTQFKNSGEKTFKESQDFGWKKEPIQNNKKLFSDFLNSSYASLTTEELIEYLKNRNLETNELKKLIGVLKEKDNELVEEILGLKKEFAQASQPEEKAEIQRQVQVKERQLQKIKETLERSESYLTKKNDFSSVSIYSSVLSIGGGILMLVAVLLLTIFWLKKRK